MVQTLGNATGGNTYGTVTVDLPRDTAAIRPSHKPWCTRCKRTGRDLNTDQMCEPCARAAVSAAALRVRWAEAEKAEKEVIYAILNQHQVPRRRGRTARAGVVDVDEAAVLVDYNLGCTAPQLAEQYGCTPKRIRSILERHGVQRRDDRAAHSGGANRFHPEPEVVDELRAAYEQGATIDELGNRFGHGRRQITRVLREAGVTIRPPVDQAGTELTNEQVAAAVADYVDGMTLQEVGKKYRIRHKRVRDLVVASGHQIRHNAATAGGTALLREHGLTALQVKRWAFDAGRIERITRGNVPRPLIEAYLEHHQAGEAA